jgi:hypothetical protein
MKTDGTPDDRPEEQHPVARVLIIAKRALFVCMLLFPAAVLGCFGIAQWIYNRQHPPKENTPQSPLPDASTFEQPVLDGIGPAIVKKYDLKGFEVKYLQSALRIKIQTSARNARRVRIGQAFAIMEDIRRLRRSTPGMPTCVWALEIDHDAPDGGMTFVLPDTVRGYEADSHWHNAALYEGASAQVGEARP